MDYRKLDEATEKVGGRFKLSVLLQKRIREYYAGAPKLVELESENLIEIAIQEILEDKIRLVPEAEEAVEVEMDEKALSGMLLDLEEEEPKKVEKEETAATEEKPEEKEAKQKAEVKKK